MKTKILQLPDDVFMNLLCFEPCRTSGDVETATYGLDFSAGLTLQRHFSEMSLETPLSRALYALSERTKLRLAELMQ